MSILLAVSIFAGLWLVLRGLVALLTRGWPESAPGKKGRNALAWALTDFLYLAVGLDTGHYVYVGIFLMVLLIDVVHWNYHRVLAN